MRVPLTSVVAAASSLFGGGDDASEPATSIGNDIGDSLQTVREVDVNLKSERFMSKHLKAYISALSQGGSIAEDSADSQRNLLPLIDTTTASHPSTTRHHEEAPQILPEGFSNWSKAYYSQKGSENDHGSEGEPSLPFSTLLLGTSAVTAAACRRGPDPYNRRLSLGEYNNLPVLQKAERWSRFIKLKTVQWMTDLASRSYFTGVLEDEIPTEGRFTQPTWSRRILSQGSKFADNLYTSASDFAECVKLGASRVYDLAANSSMGQLMSTYSQPFTEYLRGRCQSEGKWEPVTITGTDLVLIAPSESIREENWSECEAVSEVDAHSHIKVPGSFPDGEISRAGIYR